MSWRDTLDTCSIFFQLFIRFGHNILLDCRIQDCIFLHFDSHPNYVAESGRLKLDFSPPHPPCNLWSSSRIHFAIHLVQTALDFFGGVLSSVIYCIILLCILSMLLSPNDALPVFHSFIHWLYPLIIGG